MIPRKFSSDDNALSDFGGGVTVGRIFKGFRSQVDYDRRPTPLYGLRPAAFLAVQFLSLGAGTVIGSPDRR